MREGVAIGGCNSVAEWQLPKLYMAVRFRSPALKTDYGFVDVFQ